MGPTERSRSLQRLPGRGFVGIGVKCELPRQAPEPGQGEHVQRDRGQCIWGEQDERTVERFRAVKLCPREQDVARLLLMAYDNAEMAKQLGIRRRTVKAWMNRMFMKFDIHGGVKRVKLAVILYRLELEKEQTSCQVS